MTHYDTLKVSRDAPIEVIRAAYRVLSQKCHPDRHPADPAAADTMGLLNKAYEVLSDPERRRAHDAWIRQIEPESSHVPTPKAMASRGPRVAPERDR
jgi:curved DNA-binding protein CbpA